MFIYINAGFQVWVLILCSSRERAFVRFRSFSAFLPFLFWDTIAEELYINTIFLFLIVTKDFEFWHFEPLFLLFPSIFVSLHYPCVVLKNWVFSIGKANFWMFEGKLIGVIGCMLIVLRNFWFMLHSKAKPLNYKRIPIHGLIPIIKLALGMNVVLLRNGMNWRVSRFYIS